jgi:hypothetical protein
MSLSGSTVAAETKIPLHSLHTYSKLWNVLIQLQKFCEMFCQLQSHFPKAPILHKSYWFAKTVYGYSYILDNS